MVRRRRHGQPTVAPVARQRRRRRRQNATLEEARPVKTKKQAHWERRGKLAFGAT
ncbi:hypothetical protein DEO72_LG10g3560 [Vigna unguiculata]|uniref:Uncharacterized protein n=1 Tax=Vigna unguiculata TaxID=3917 RepID=A0A4D6NG38_VIGUN|nr:hypothetical protein DEO72_LG10g3560 [Vigna unguiculata]